MMVIPIASTCSAALTLRLRRSPAETSPTARCLSPPTGRSSSRTITESEGATTPSTRSSPSPDEPRPKMNLQQRATATVYTSGEHCPMCAAAHGWVGLGRIVYASLAAQMTEWFAELSGPAFRVRPLPISDVIRDTVVYGPAEEFATQVRALRIRSHSG